MLKMKRTAAVLSVCYVQCGTCARALQVQRPPPAPQQPPWRGRATARRYLNDDSHFASADVGGASAVLARPRTRLDTVAAHPRGRAAPVAAPAPKELLTAAEEKAIAMDIRRLRSVTEARERLREWMTREVASHHGEVSERQWAAACSLSVSELQEVLARGQEARTRLITGNVGLVTMTAKRYHQMVRLGGRGAHHGDGGSLKLDDLIQEGNLGIMEAAERFDPERGFRFSTYATHWIRQRIVRAIAESSRTIRLPQHVQTMLRHMQKKNKEMQAQIGRLPSLPELAHEMGVPLGKVQLYQHATRNVLSLELPLDRGRAAGADARARTLGDRVACDEVATPEEDFLSASLRGEVRAMLDVLGHDERGVLAHRFGLEAVGAPKTLRETAAAMGVSVDKVRTTEARALNKLRRPQANYRLKDYVGMGPAEAGDGADAERAEPRPPRTNKGAAKGAKERRQPHSMIAARWNAHDEARTCYLDKQARRSPESIWSF